MNEVPFNQQSKPGLSENTDLQARAQDQQLMKFDNVNKQSRLDSITARNMARQEISNREYVRNSLMKLQDDELFGKFNCKNLGIITPK